jgi:hypothetical protein
MILIFLLVHHVDGEFTSKWPLQIVVKFTLHLVDKDRDVRTLASMTTPRHIL